MKKLFFLLVVLFQLSKAYAQDAQNLPVLVVQQLEVKNISNSDVPNRVYDAITGAIKRCGNCDVRFNHEWRDKTTKVSELSYLEKELRDILLDLYLYRHGNTEEEQRKLNDFKKMITTSAVVVGKLQHNNHRDNAFELVLYFVDLNSFMLLIPPLSISFEAYEMEDFKIIEGKLLKELVKEGFCEISTTTLAPPITPEWLEQTIEWLVRLEICFPNDKEVRNEVRRVVTDEITNIMYLDQKALIYGNRLDKMLRDENCSKETIKKTAEILISTYRKLSEFSHKDNFYRYIRRIERIIRD